MNKVDNVYKLLVLNIIGSGKDDFKEKVRPKYADGTPAHTVKEIVVNFEIQNSENDSFPLIKSKKVGWKWAFEEILWIWQRKSNNINDLKRTMNITIWDEWADEDGSINKAYGYQLAKRCRNLNGTMVDQVDYLLHNLKNRENLRRNYVTLWNVDDLDEMNLNPCVHSTNWIIDGEYLDIQVFQRSGDVALGIPFNISQYAFLHRLIAKEVGLKSRKIYWNLADAHIYDRHIDLIKKQINEVSDNERIILTLPDKSFYDVHINDIKIEGYNQAKDNYKYEVAI